MAIDLKQYLGLPHGDMPGDKVEIGEEHVKKALVIMDPLMEKLDSLLEKNGKAVVAVCGGSGVGKSETASLISHMLREQGIGAYTMSGDNYPRRIPMYNDAERLRIFRSSGVKGLVKCGEGTMEHFDILRKWQEEETDADKAHVSEYPWAASYINAGRAGLEGYLGTKNEIDFDEVSSIVKAFKSGQNKIYLKRMGRTDSELWYEEVDFSNVQVLVIEWTHGNSDYYEGVDIPILLNSTPEETLAHRRARNRDGKTDSAFTMLVLELEQNLLKSQAHKAQIILSKAGELLTYAQYQELMR
ncbi:MAG: adenylylsulfate kinase [Pseudobutyrivibrio ruminis]|nr:adenylylsulfate kinase [Pseudobutyrivibrio ruminis]